MASNVQKFLDSTKKALDEGTEGDKKIKGAWESLKSGVVEGAMSATELLTGGKEDEKKKKKSY